MTSPVEALNSFKQKYELRSPARASTPQESVPLDFGAGLRLLSPAPALNVAFGKPPTSRNDPGHNRYLWVIDCRGIPYIREVPISALGGNLPKHTNLTGGGDAFIGGELWFCNEEGILVSGGSGRYPPIDADQLAAAVDVFAAYQYQVKSLGWDPERGRAIRILVNGDE